jgi:hypothetical protein
MVEFRRSYRAVGIQKSCDRFAAGQVKLDPTFENYEVDCNSSSNGLGFGREFESCSRHHLNRKRRLDGRLSKLPSSHFRLLTAQRYSDGG